MDAGKKLKRGEILFKEGDAPATIYIVQSGKIGLMVERNGKYLEIASLGPNQVFGEQALFSTGKQAFTAQALQEAKVMEVPVDLMKQQFEKAMPGVKLLVKSLVDETRVARQNTKTLKLETEKSPLPQGHIHKLFTEVHLIARHIGKRGKPAETLKPGQQPEPYEPGPHEFTVAWNAMKLYATRFFGESPQRLRHMMDLMAKLKFADLKIGKSDEGEETLLDVHFFDVQLCEDFAEFYQYHLFKGSRAEAIYVDPLALKVAKALVELSEGAPVNHKGASLVDYNMVLNECKTKYRIDLKNTHLDALERKGLFTVRKSFDDGRVELSFDRNEFVKMAHFWSIIFEIDKWNDKGFVDLNEKEEAAAGPEGECVACHGKIDQTHKFCPHCGHKLAAAA
jgi:hypothetical protein